MGFMLETARTRKAAGCAALLLYMTLYAAAAAALGTVLVTTWPGWAQLLYFAVAGIVWILPLKPLFGWMNRGR
jgi:membrane protein implicated in regulation of membrane protease activity